MHVRPRNNRLQQVRIKAHRHIKFARNRNLHCRGRRHLEAHHAAGRIDGPACGLLNVGQEKLSRAVNNLGERPVIRRGGQIVIHIALENLELGLHPVPRPDGLLRHLKVGKILEPEAVGAAPAGMKETEDCRPFGAAARAQIHGIVAAGLRPVDIALLMTGIEDLHGGRKTRAAAGPIGNRGRKADIVKTHGLSIPSQLGLRRTQGIALYLALTATETVGIGGIDIERQIDG